MSNAPGYRKRYLLARHRGIPTSTVPAAPTRNHLQSLVDLGWTLGGLSHITGISNQGLSEILTSGQQTVRRTTAARVRRARYTLAVPDVLPDGAFVPAEGARRRLQALYAIGWTRALVANQLEDTNPAHITRGAYPTMRAYRWREIDALYQRLHMTPGPSAITRRRAAHMGYAAPLSWEDIDDPDATPVGTVRDESHVDEAVVLRILDGDNRVHANTAERVEVCRRWVAAGRSLKALERLTGWRPDRYYKIEEGAA